MNRALFPPHFPNPHLFINTMLDLSRYECRPYNGEEYFAIDHIGYSAGTLDRYRQLVSDTATYGNILSEHKLINGRPISIIRLKRPFPFTLGKKPKTVSLIEIAAPRPDIPAFDGWEHVEVMVEDLHNFLAHQPHIRQNFDASQIDDTINPSLILQFKTGRMIYHSRPIIDVIRDQLKAKT